MDVFMPVKDNPEFFKRIKNMSGSRTGTGGCMSIKDSGWQLSLSLYN
jgi:oleate hydratase